MPVVVPNLVFLKWCRVQELNEKASAEIIITIIGNKIDLEGHVISKEEAEQYCQKQGLQYYEVSAK